MLPITQGFVSESQRLEHESTIRAVNVLSKTAAVEETLIGSMQDMRIDVLERNTAIAAEMQELQEKLESVYQYLQEKVIPQRELEFSKLRSTLETELEALDKFICEQTQNTTEQHWSVLDAEIERTKEVLAAEEEFYRLEIPRLCDAQCNGAVKTLKKHRQDFDLDLKTISVREARIDSRIQKYHSDCVKRADNEIVDAKKQVDIVRSEWLRTQSIIDSSLSMSTAIYPQQLEAIEETLKTEKALRANSDILFVKAMGSVLQRIQDEAMEVYGGHFEDNSAEGGGW